MYKILFFNIKTILNYKFYLLNYKILISQFSLKVAACYSRHLHYITGLKEIIVS